MIAKHQVYIWNGILFKNEINLSGENSDERTTIAIMFAMGRAVAERAAESMGPGKLGEVFKALVKSHDLDNFRQKVYFEFNADCIDVKIRE